jgi:hypothetical protein
VEELKKTLRARAFKIVDWILCCKVYFVFVGVEFLYQQDGGTPPNYASRTLSMSDSVQQGEWLSLTMLPIVILKAHKQSLNEL